LPVRTGIRPVAGFAKALASQASPCPGLARQWHGSAYAVAGLGRTELDAAPCPDREEPAMRARAETGAGAVRAGLYPPGRFWVLPGPRR
jgi:hypothetical protein